MGADDHGDDHGHGEGLDIQGLKILAIFIILIASVIGAVAPVVFAWLSKDKRRERNIQAVIKVMTCLSIGIVLCTALIHMLPEGMYLLKESGNSLFADKDDHHDEGNASSSANHTEDSHEEHSHPYPYGFLFAMVSIAVVFFISTEINWYGARRLKEMKGVACDEKEEERLGAMIKLYLLDIGIAVHSVIIGVTMGISNSRSNVVTLFIVLCIHQLFEGLAVGSLAVLAQVTRMEAVFFIGLFAVTCPIGIAIGMGSGGDDKVAQGVLQCISGGILLHMAMVDMLPHVFGAHSHGPLPLAKLHDHILRGSTTAAAAAGGDASAQTQAATTTQVVQVVACGAAATEKDNNGKNDDADNNDKKEEAVSGGGDVRESIAGEFVDDHESDESFSFRVICYVAFTAGCAIQGVLGIWA